MGSTLQGDAKKGVNQNIEENQKSSFNAAILITPEDGRSDGSSDAPAQESSVDGNADEPTSPEDTNTSAKDESTNSKTEEDAGGDATGTDGGIKEEGDSGNEKSEPSGETENGEDGEEKNYSPRANNRIRELVGKYKSEREKREALEARIAALEANQPKNTDNPQDKGITDEQLLETINPETGDYYTKTEVKLIRLEERLEREQTEREQAAQTSSYRSNAERVGKLSADAIAKHSWLDENSEDFDAERASKVASLFTRGYMRTDKDGNITEVAEDIETGLTEIIEAYAPKKVVAPKAEIKRIDPVGAPTHSPLRKPEKTGFAGAITVTNS